MNEHCISWMIISLYLKLTFYIIELRASNWASKSLWMKKKIKLNSVYESMIWIVLKSIYKTLIYKTAYNPWVAISLKKWKIVPGGKMPTSENTKTAYFNPCAYFASQISCYRSSFIVNQTYFFPYAKKKEKLRQVTVHKFTPVISFCIHCSFCVFLNGCNISFFLFM